MDGDGDTARRREYFWVEGPWNRLLHPEACLAREVRTMHARGGLPGGELSPAGGCGGGAGRPPSRQGRTRGSRLTGSRSSKKWGRGDSREGGRPKATPFRYAFPLRPLQLPAAPSKDSLPPYLTPSRLRAKARTLRTATAGRGMGVRRGSWGHEGQDPKCKLSAPSWDNPKRLHMQRSQPCNRALWVCAGRSSLTLQLFLIKSITLPSGSWLGGKREEKGGNAGKSGGSGNQLCNPALPRAIRRHA